MTGGFCTACGTELRSGVAFCTSCGTPVGADVPAESQTFISDPTTAPVVPSNRAPAPDPPPPGFTYDLQGNLIPVAVPPPVVSPAGATTAMAGPPAADPSGPSRRSRTPVYVAAAMLALVLIGGAVAFFVTRDGGSDATATTGDSSTEESPRPKRTTTTISTTTTFRSTTVPTTSTTQPPTPTTVKDHLGGPIDTDVYALMRTFMDAAVVGDWNTFRSIDRDKAAIADTKLSSTSEGYGSLKGYRFVVVDASPLGDGTTDVYFGLVTNESVTGSDRFTKRFCLTWNVNPDPTNRRIRQYGSKEPGKRYRDLTAMAKQGDWEDFNDPATLTRIEQEMTAACS